MFSQADQSARAQPSFMSAAVVEASAEAIGQHCARFNQERCLIAFHGGEPTLAGKNWFVHATEAVRRSMPASCKVQFAMQTNGVLIDGSWLDLCADLDISISVSLDGPPDVHDRDRGAGSYAHAVAAIRRIQEHPGMKDLFGGVLAVVRPGADGRAVYRHLRDLGIEAIDFLLPVEANWDNPPDRSASPTPFADYLIPAFDEWWADGGARVEYFDSLLRLVVGSRIHADALGGDPLTMVVIDCDGSIEPVDSLRSCGDGFTRLGLNVATSPIERAFQQPAFQHALAGQEGLCAVCKACELRDTCGGGYLPSRYRRSNAFDNPSVYCPDLMKLIRHAIAACSEAAATACASH